MAERASVFEAIQWGVEVTKGTAVKPNRLVQSLSVTPSFQIATNRFRPRGNKLNTVQTKGKDWTQAEVTGQPTYAEILYPLAGVITTPTINTTGVGTGGGEFTMNMSSTSEDSPASFTVEAGSNANRAMRFSYGMFTDFTLKYSRDNIEASGTMMGQRLLEDRVRYIVASGTVSGGTFDITVAGDTASAIAYDATASEVQTALEGTTGLAAGDVTVTASGGDLPTGVYIIAFADDIDLSDFDVDSTSLTGGGTYADSRIAPAATALTLVPVVPEHVSIYLDTTAAGLGGTKLLRVFNAEWAIAQRYNPVWPIDAAQQSFAAHVEGVPDVTVKLTIEADAQGMALVQVMREGDRRFLRIEAVGEEYDTGHNHTLRLDTALTIGDIQPLKDNDGVVAFDLTLYGAHDTTWGKGVSAYVKTNVQAL